MKYLKQEVRVNVLMLFYTAFNDFPVVVFMCDTYIVLFRKGRKKIQLGNREDSYMEGSESVTKMSRVARKPVFRVSAG